MYKIVTYVLLVASTISLPTTEAEPVAAPEPEPLPEPNGPYYHREYRQTVDVNVTLPTLLSVTIANNCDFCDHALVTITGVASALNCAFRCAANPRCSHFVHIANLNGGTCELKTAFGTGVAWATKVNPSQGFTCGYVPFRALAKIFLGLCLGLDVGVGVNVALGLGVGVGIDVGIDVGVDVGVDLGLGLELGK